MKDFYDNNNENNEKLDIEEIYNSPYNRPLGNSPYNDSLGNSPYNDPRNNMNFNSGNVQPEKTKVSKGIILLIVVCLVIGVFGIAIEKIKSRNEPKRVAGDAPVMTQNRKVPKDRKEYFHVDGADTADTTEEVTEELTTANPFAYIYEQYGINDAMGGGEGSGSGEDEGRTYGKHEVFDDMLEAGEYLSYLVDKGVTGMVDIYISDKIINKFSEIQTGYYYHNYLANLSETYYWTEVGNNTYRINITITRSDCGYVYRNIVYGEKIPEDKDKAIRVREEVENIYNEIVKPGMSDFEIELALHDRVVSKCKYIGTQSSYDIQHSAYGSLVNKEAVCDGYSKGLALLLTRAGIDNEVIYGIAGGPHAWNQVKIDGVWYMVDATWDDPEYSSKKETAFHPYFNVSGEFLSTNHSWISETYHECPSMKDNYFNHYGYVYSGQKDYEEAMKERITENGQGVYESIICDAYSVDNAFVREVSGGRFSEYYNDILNDYYFANVIIK